MQSIVLPNRPLLDGLWSATRSREKQTRMYLAKGFGKLNGTNKTSFNLLLEQLDVRFRRTGASDKEALDFIYQYMNLLVYPINGYPMNESVGRADSRCRTIMDILKALPMKINNFVDVGCSTGSITSSLEAELGLPLKKTHGVDVLPVENVNRQITYHKVSGDTATVLPFKSQSVTLVTMLMSLHHIEYVATYIDEVQRILEPGGIFIVKEHDVESDDPSLANALDALHGLYSVSWARTGQQEDPNFPECFFASYRTKETWSDLIEKSGLMKRLETPHTKRLYTMSPNNQMFAYWAVYIKQ